MTLAELYAVSALMAPGHAGAIGPITQMLPMYAAREGITIDLAYAREADQVIAGIVDMIPDLCTVDMQRQAGEQLARLASALNPDALRLRLMDRIKLAA